MTKPDESEFTPLFNGENLDGWFSIPRVYTPLWEGGPTVEEAFAHLPAEQRFDPAFLADSHDHEAVWSVEDGAITGRQAEDARGFGGFLLTEGTYADFELRLEAKPDWPADTGILVRKTPTTWRGIQILVDHRRSGSIGGYYGNGIGSFHAVSFNLDGVLDEAGRLVRLVEEDPETTIEPIGDKAALLEYGATGEQFLEAWHTGEWNEFRIRVEGSLPRITTWINDVKISEIDLATLQFEHYDAEATAQVLGRAGHIALEVHDTDPMLGEARWGTGAACRWRNVRVLELPTA
jgi:hypothetical protein